MNEQNKLWGGRFSAASSDLMERFSQSVSFDRRLYRQDIAGSIAHARMLAKQGILTDDEFEQIERGLAQIRDEIESGGFDWSVVHEDVHMNIEAALTEKVGDAGKKLHTGRSRNDQVATDMRLYLREEVDGICDGITRVQHEIVKRAGRESETIMPGFTHMQAAQPVTFGHHLLAWNEMLERDHERLRDCRRRINVCPLGCAALAGTGFPLDREMTARELGFERVSANSLDAVSDRDFVMEFAAAAALTMVHFSRMAEELVLWSSPAFDFIELDDAFCTGSSIMPQKKNPDVAELLRGKSGRAIGNLVALLTLMKGQPLAYNRDNQEDKEPVFDTVETLKLCLAVFAAMMPGITVKPENMRAAAEAGFSTATDLADYLVRKQVPFRDAHEIVGKIVACALKQSVALHELSLGQFRGFCRDIDGDVYDVLTLDGSVASRNHVGGTAPESVRRAAEDAALRLRARTAEVG